MRRSCKAFYHLVPACRAKLLVAVALPNWPSQSAARRQAESPANCTFIRSRETSGSRADLVAF